MCDGPGKCNTFSREKKINWKQLQDNLEVRWEEFFKWLLQSYSLRNKTKYTFSEWTDRKSQQRMKNQNDFLDEMEILEMKNTIFEFLKM